MRSVVAGSNLYRNNSGASYPYTIGGLVSITSSNSTTNWLLIIISADWEVQELPCESTPATYTINVSAGPSSIIPIALPTYRSVHRQFRRQPRIVELGFRRW